MDPARSPSARYGGNGRVGSGRCGWLRVRAMVGEIRAVALHPAGCAATRFPGKPLAPIAGVPLVQRVWMGTREAKSVERVVIATDDARIAEACRAFGAEVAMTRGDHPTGTDRIAEAAAGL